MSYTYKWTGPTGQVHAILGELENGATYTTDKELAGPYWSAPSDTTKGGDAPAPVKPAKEKTK